jgi:hypothetical protein
MRFAPRISGEIWFRTIYGDNKTQPFMMRHIRFSKGRLKWSFMAQAEHEPFLDMFYE